MTTLTLVRPPTKTQNRLLTGRPSTTLITTSTLLVLKNQRYPVSPVSETAEAVPVAVVDVQTTVTLNRPALRQRIVAPGTQGTPLPATVKVLVYSLSVSSVSAM